VAVAVKYNFRRDGKVKEALEKVDKAKQKLTTVVQESHPVLEDAIKLKNAFLSLS